jgi:hypothetical protein
MPQNTPIDNYTLTLEATADGSGRQTFHAVATNIKDRRIVESQLDSGTVRSLLTHAYGGEMNIVDVYIDRLAAHQVITLEATAKDPLILTVDELIRFGFSEDELFPVESA